jgi:hypothetical protein
MQLLLSITFQNKMIKVKALGMKDQKTGSGCKCPRYSRVSINFFDNSNPTFNTDF